MLRRALPFLLPLLLALPPATAAGAAAGAGSPPIEVIVELGPPPAAREGFGRAGRERRAAAALREIERAQLRLEARLRAAVPEAEVRWRYRIVLAGIAVALPANEVSRLERLPGVVRVYPSVRYGPLLDRSPTLIGAPAIWGPGLENGGAGIKIGVIDDGIDQTHPFFDPAGVEMPSGFPRGDLGYTNAKVIVARAFPPARSHWSNASLPFDPVHSFHGTHVAGIAAGDAGTIAPPSFDRPPIEELSGVAPLAYLGNYKVLTIPTDSGVGLNGNSPEIVAGIEAAVADGMDVINLSLGEPQIDPERDAVARALDNAAAAGVVPVVAAGNDFDALGRGSIGSPGTAARAITVAAVNGDRYFGIGASVVGPEPVPDALQSFGGRPGGVIPESFGEADQRLLDPATAGLDGSACAPFPGESLDGALALVRGGTCADSVKARNVRRAGGIGMVLAAPGPGDPPFPPFLAIPTLAVAHSLGEDLAAAAAAAPARELLIRIENVPAEVTSEEAGLIAPFSASGPTPLGLTAKPDVSAPGVGILSATPDDEFELFSGTSMATPHVAGAAALLLEIHPDWTVEEVKSALVLTGRPVGASPGATAQTPSARQGGGLVDLPEASEPLVFASPQSVGFGLLDVSEGAAGAEARVELTDAGGGSGIWHVSIEMEEPGVGAIVSAPAEVSVPGVLDVTALATAAAAEGDRTGFLVLERDGERRRLPWWLGITRSRLDEAPARHLRRPGIYHADASTGGSRVTAYRYPDAPVLVRTRLPGPEQVFRFVLGRPVANFGVAVTRSGRGVVVEPRIVAGADENRLLGVTALPYVSNPYLPTLYAPTRSAAALLPSPGAYSIVFDTPGAGRAGLFTFRFWIDDVTPPSVRLISARATAGRILARVGDRGAGVDPAAIFYTVDGSSLRQARYDAQRGIAVIPVGFAGEGTHRLVLRVSDRQEAKNTENVPLILPNTRVVRATIRVP